jgi:glycosyltransferase involved in cell wall biosynthesis
MKKKKVIFVGAFNKNNSLNTGGIIFACQGLLNSSLSDKIEWQLIDTTPDTNLKRSFLERTVAAIKRLKEFIFLLFGGSTDVLIFMGGYRASVIEKGLMTIFAKLAGKRVVLCPVTGLLPSFVLQSVLMRLFVRFTFLCAYRVVSQSESWRAFFLENVGLAPEKYTIIRNWINLDVYHENFERQLQKPQNPKIAVLYLGWVIRDKGVFELVEAFLKLSDLDIELWVAGDGDDLLALKQQADSFNLKNIRFFGWVFNDQKMELLKKADIFVLPSYFEGLPNALLEAMASGIPVIASNVGGIPDLIQNGKNGFLAEPRNPSVLSEKIRLLAENRPLRKTFSEQAYTYVKDNHSFDKAIAAFNEIL